MPRLTSERLPKYRKHKATGQAIVALDGRDFYLGSYGTKASKLEYDRLTSLWLANGRRLPKADSDLMICELLVEYMRFATRHYRRKDGSQTHELVNIASAIRPLRAMYGKLRVCEFGPLRLLTLQACFVKGYTASDGTHVKGVSRGTVNARIASIKRIFAWAVSRELAPPALAHALGTVRGLQRGRTEARECPPIRPVDDATVAATLRFLPAVVADMVRVQRLTGCRPGEVCCMKPCDVDRSVNPWRYRPEINKMAHLNRERVIFIGPRAQAVLLPYLLRDASAYCFSPAESEASRRIDLRARRRSKVQPSQVDRRKRRPKLEPGNRYRKDAYRRAVVRACDVADRQAHKDDPSIPNDQRIVDRWAPNRLRHSAATEIRQKFGTIEAARTVLGHAKGDVTLIYAERDERLAADIIKQIG